MRRLLPAIVAVLVVALMAGTIWNSRLIGAALRDGKKARATQCRTFPVTAKLYRAAKHYHLISSHDLDTFLASAPHDCR